MNFGSKQKFVTSTAIVILILVIEIFTPKDDAHKSSEMSASIQVDIQDTWKLSAKNPRGDFQFCFMLNSPITLVFRDIDRV